MWNALSDAFLDTETRWYFPRIAGRLVESGYSRAELDRIWRYEVVPECAWNVFQVAGEWVSLDLDEEALIRRASKPPGRWTRWRIRALQAAVPFLEEQWRSLLTLRQCLLSYPEDERPEAIEVWSQFARAYLEEELEQITFLDSALSRLQEVGGSRTRCETTFERDFRPIYRRLLIGRERGEEESRAENVQELIRRAFDSVGGADPVGGSTGKGPSTGSKSAPRFPRS